MTVKTGVAVIAVAVLAMAPAYAQTKPVPKAGTGEVIPEKKGEPLYSGRSESLSKKLSRTDGVIKPKDNVDPGMKAPAPDPKPHSTPVIPPSATGGDNAK